MAMSEDILGCDNGLYYWIEDRDVACDPMVARTAYTSPRQQVTMHLKMSSAKVQKPQFLSF